MKKALIVILVFLLVLGMIGAAAYVWLTREAEQRVTTQITETLSQALDSRVQVEDIDIRPIQGIARLRNFSVAEPEPEPTAEDAAPKRRPFTERIAFGELEADIDYLNRKVQSLRITGPVINVEAIPGGSTVPAPSGSGRRFAIDRVIIRNARLGLYNPETDEYRQFQIPSLELNNLNGTPEQLADRIMQSVAGQIGDPEAGRLLLNEGRRQLPGLNFQFEDIWGGFGG